MRSILETDTLGDPARVMALRAGGLLFVVVASAACFADQGPGGDTALSATGTTSSSGTTSPASTGPTITSGSGASTTTTGGEPTSSSGIDTGSGPTSGSTTVDDPNCGVLGAPCDSGCCGCLVCADDSNTCVADDAACKTCRQCGPAGECVPAPAKTQCKDLDPSCLATVFGPFDGTCYAYASGLGECDGAGQCVLTGCTGQGEPIESCKSAACTLEDKCAPDTPAEEVSFDSLCVTNASTPGCSPACSNEPSGSSVEVLGCDDQSDCVKLGQQDCGAYTCSGDACLTDCVIDNDCADGFECDVQGQCVAP